MKILKPGKVEMRKFVCPNCGCVFAVGLNEARRAVTKSGAYDYWAQCTCREYIFWDKGEPYEEPTPTQSDREREKERLTHILLKMPAFSGCEDDAAYLIANGVTFREDAT